MLTITELTLIGIFMVISVSCATLGAILFFLLRGWASDLDGIDYEKSVGLETDEAYEDADIIEYLDSLKGRRN